MKHILLINLHKVEPELCRDLVGFLSGQNLSHYHKKAELKEMRHSHILVCTDWSY